LAGAKAISSDMFFGDETQESNDSNHATGGRSSTLSGVNYDEYKEQATILARKVSDQAKMAKGKVVDWFSTKFAKQ